MAVHCSAHTIESGNANVAPQFDFSLPLPEAPAEEDDNKDDSEEDNEVSREQPDVVEEEVREVPLVETNGIYDYDVASVPEDMQV